MGNLVNSSGTGSSGGSLWTCLMWLYSGTVSVLCTVCGLMAVVCGYEGWKQDFVNIGQKNFVRFSLFLGIILIVFVIVWNLSAMFFLKASLQLSEHLSTKREPHQSSQTSLGSLRQQNKRNFSQVSGLLMLGMLLVCISLEVAGTGYLWYVFLQISDVYERRLRNNITHFCDASNEESVCKEAYNQFKSWFLIFRMILPVLALLKFPAFLINCFAWVIVDLDNGHPLNHVRNSGNPNVPFSFNQCNDPIDYYGNMSLPIGERPQPIGQELTPKLAASRTAGAGSRALSNKPVCVPCPKAPLDRFQSRGHCSTPVRLENILCSPMLGLQVPTPELASFNRAVNVNHQKSKSFRPRLEVTGKSWCVDSSYSAMGDNQFYDRSGQKLPTPSSQISRTDKGSFSSETNQHCSYNANSNPSHYINVGPLVKPQIINKSQILRSKLPSPPPPPPPGLNLQGINYQYGNNGTPSTSLQRRWSTNHGVFSSTSPKLPKKDHTENYASLSRSFGKRLASHCIIENI